MGVWSSSSPIKSIQRGTFIASASPVTVSAVDMSKSVLNFLGFSNVVSGSDTLEYVPRIWLSSATQISAYAEQAAASLNISYELIEYY